MTVLEGLLDKEALALIWANAFSAGFLYNGADIGVENPKKAGLTSDETVLVSTGSKYGDPENIGSVVVFNSAGVVCTVAADTTLAVVLIGAEAREELLLTVVVNCGAKLKVSANTDPGSEPNEEPCE